MESQNGLRHGFFAFDCSETAPGRLVLIDKIGYYRPEQPYLRTGEKGSPAVKRPVTALAALVCSLALLAHTGFAQENAKRTIAILDFNNNSIADRDRLEPLRKGLADILITEISKVDAFRVVERDKLREVVMELEFGQSELVDPSTAQKMGKLLGAQNLLFGGFVHSGGDNIRVDVRIVEVETGRTIKAVEARGDLEDIFDIVEDLSSAITEFFKIELTEADRKRQSEGGASESFDATLAYSKSIDFEDLGRQYEAQGKTEEAKAMYGKALELLEQALSASPEFRDAAAKAASIRSHLKQL